MGYRAQGIQGDVRAEKVEVKVQQNLQTMPEGNGQPFVVMTFVFVFRHIISPFGFIFRILTTVLRFLTRLLAKLAIPLGIVAILYWYRDQINETWELSNEIPATSLQAATELLMSYRDTFCEFLLSTLDTLRGELFSILDAMSSFFENLNVRIDNLKYALK